MTSRTIRGGAKLWAAALVGIALGAGGLVALAEPPRSGHAPDPPARASVKQWVFDVVSRRGRITVEQVRPVTLRQPAATARVMGRYAFELYVGQELLDRVRFNVPLTGDGPPETSEGPKRPFTRPTFEDVTTRMRLQMADNPRAAYAMLVDRASGEAQRFEWPPGPDGRLVPMTKAASSAVIVEPDAGVPTPRDASIPDGTPPGPPAPGPDDASVPDGSPPGPPGPPGPLGKSSGKSSGSSRGRPGPGR